MVCWWKIMFCKGRSNEAVSQTTVTIYILTMQMRQNKDLDPVRTMKKKNANRIFEFKLWMQTEIS